MYNFTLLNIEVRNEAPIEYQLVKTTNLKELFNLEVSINVKKGKTIDFK